MKLGIFLLLALWFSVLIANAGEFYPPVSVLQDQLPVHPGDRLGKLVNWHGELYQPVYVRATGVNGTYYVTLKLVRASAPH